MPETSSFIDQLAEVSRRQGKPFIDPTRIEGFGPGSAPAPSLKPEDVKIPTAAEMFGGPAVEAEPAEGTPESSPLVAVGLGGLAFTPVPEPAVPPGPKPELLVMGPAAAYRDRGVMLNDQEQALVIGVVLKALKRSMLEQYAEIEKLLPRRRRKSKVQPVAAASEPAPIKKKRGRPKKVTQL